MSMNPINISNYYLPLSFYDRKNLSNAGTKKRYSRATTKKRMSETKSSRIKPRVVIASGITSLTMVLMKR
jgi:hypothetical protein